MKAQTAIDHVARGRIIAIIRGETGGCLDEIAEVLADAGITAVELTLNSPDALRSIARLASRVGTRIAVGAGTVLTPVAVSQAADAGATFVVSPDCMPGVIDATVHAGLASFPGCMSPTEISIALAHGADAVKLFPATSLGPGFIRAMHGPRAALRMIPTGGITAATVGSWLEAGAWAVGIGGELIGRDVIAPGGMDRLRARAVAFVTAVEPWPPRPEPIDA